MKKISQAIITATLILDVAVIFTFGLAVISSFEDGSRLPETTFVRKASEGRVAGVTISTCPTTANVFIETPIAGSVIAAETFGISAMAGTSVPASALMNFVYPITVSPFYKRIPAVYQSYTTPNGATYNKWIADVNVMVEQISKGFFTFKAEGYDSIGNCIARSDSRSISINFTSSNTLPAPAVNITAPLPGSVLSGTQAAVIGEISNLPSGTQIQEALINIFNNATQVAGPFSAPAPNTANPFARQSKFDSTTIANGAYDVKMFVHYLDSNSVLKFIESAPISVNIDNASTASTNTSNNQNANSGAGTNSGANYNSNTSNTNTSTANANTSTSTSGTNTNSAISTNNNTSTDTTTPPPTGTAAAALTAAMINPTPSTIPTILRSRDNQLISKTSAAVSGLKFIVHKSGEPADWITPITAELTDGINWKANMNLTVFKDGAYNIAAVSGDIKSESVNVIVQRFSSKWFTPNKGDELAKKAVLRTEINGIYEITDKIPLKDIVVEFWQVGVTSSYPPKYIGRAQKRPDSHEWFYEWNTTDSPLGECRLELRIGNAAYSTTKGSLYNTEPLLVKVSNQTSSASLSGSSNSNANQNSNTPSSVNSNTANVNKAANNAINSSTNFNQNTNTAAASNSNLNSAQGASNINSAVVDAVPTQTDSDNDKLSDEKEVLSGTNPNSNDSDGDGLFDHEEVEDHGTNPLNVDTDGDGYNDFEEIQSGHDPLVKPTDPTTAVLVKSKPIEEPKASEKPISKELVVEKIENKEIKTTQSPSANDTNGQASTSEITENTIVLKGKGPANTILTLFIYSEDPIVVTVRTNENGEWIYELDKTLEDGEHEVYATITDDTGKIESTSSPMRFLVKQAVAETMPERADTGANSIPGSSSTNLYLLISGIMVFVAIVVGFIIALKRKRGDTNQIT